eukprot:861349_1
MSSVSNNALHPSSMQHIIVPQTGHVDSQYNPIYEPKSNDIDLDFINNDDDLFDQNKPISKSNYDPIAYWHLQNTIKPYFMNDNDINTISENQLLVKTETELTQKK